VGAVAQSTKGENAVKPPTVTLGAIQFGEDRNVTPVVCIDCPDEGAAEHVAALLLKIQNGGRTMAGQDEAFTAGDVAIKVIVDRHPTRPKEAVLVSVRARLDAQHLTEAFYVASTVEADPAQVFRFMNMTYRNFVITVAVEGQPCCDLLYLMKYDLVWRSPIEAGPP